jgi:hypothetical protein
MAPPCLHSKSPPSTSTTKWSSWKLPAEGGECGTGGAISSAGPTCGIFQPVATDGPQAVYQPGSDIRIISGSSAAKTISAECGKITAILEILLICLPSIHHPNSTCGSVFWGAGQGENRRFDDDCGEGFLEGRLQGGGAIAVKSIMVIADYAFVLLKTIRWEGNLTFRCGDLKPY